MSPPPPSLLGSCLLCHGKLLSDIYKQCDLYGRTERYLRIYDSLGSGWCQLPTLSIPTLLIPTFSTSHFVNSHFVNSHFITLLYTLLGTYMRICGCSVHHADVEMANHKILLAVQIDLNYWIFRKTGGLRINRGFIRSRLEEKCVQEGQSTTFYRHLLPSVAAIVHSS